MVTTRKSAVSSTAAPAKPVVAVKPSAKLAATPAGRKNAAKTGKAKATKAGKGKPAAADAATTKAKAAKPAKADKAGKARSTKAAKPKVVRDRFSFPKAEYAVLDSLKDRAVKAGKAVKKSELLRAGLKALAALPDLAFRTALDALPARKRSKAKN